MTRWIDEVDPWIGTASPGNCLCGPSRPLGLVRLGPDSILPQPTQGYEPGQPIRCFSHTHCSGTGGQGRYGNIALTPFTHGLAPAVTGYVAQDEVAGCGFYRVRLQPGDIVVELTVAPRAGLTVCTFPAGSPARIHLDVGAAIQVGHGQPVKETGGSVGGTLCRVSDRAWQGHGVYQGGWGHGEPYTIYFHAEFDQPIRRAWSPADGAALPEEMRGPNLAASLEFDPGSTVVCAVGLSLLSAEQARANCATGIGSRSPADLRKETEQAWSAWLGRWRVDGGSAEVRKLFYTFVTRMLCMPTDLGVDEENPAWRSGVRQFWDHYCLWDSFRGAHGWLGLVAPELERDQLAAMIDVAEHTGWLPDAWIAGHHGYRQGGSPAAILLAEAAEKELTGLDYKAALRLMIQDAETPSADTYTRGRRDLAGYRERGWVSVREMGCVSRTLEYAWHDAAIARLAGRLGERATADHYAAQAARIWALWRDDVQALAPRDDQGRWVESYHPARHSAEPIWHDPYFYEGLGYDWTASLLFDLPGWRARCGGPAGLERWLDRYWKIRQHWKEIQMHIPWLFIEAGRPDLATDAVATMRDTQYQARRDGLHDNEDMGAHAAFYMGSALGLYPCSGTDRWWLSVPLFPRVEMQVGPQAATLVVETRGPVGAGAHIAAAQLNGVALTTASLRHRDLARGGLLQLQTTQGASSWGRSL